MNKLYIFLFILISGLVFASCDVLDGPYLENPDITDPGDVEIPKKVLVLEFTGHTCKSCPKAHRTIDQMEETYKDRVIPVAIHTGYFARTQSGDKFNYDFRTAQGAEMEKYYEFTSFPIGLVGSLNKDMLDTYSSWPAKVSSLIALKAEVGLSSSSVYYESTRKVQVEVSIMNKKTISGEVMLAVYLVEDGIISWQKDEDQDPIDVEDYEHKHVFRTSAGSVWGSQLDESDCAPNANAQVSKTISLEPSWVLENCSIVTVLYNNANKEVIQCSSEKLIK